VDDTINQLCCPLCGTAGTAVLDGGLPRLSESSSTVATEDARGGSGAAAGTSEAHQSTPDGTLALDGSAVAPAVDPTVVLQDAACSLEGDDATLPLEVVEPKPAPVAEDSTLALEEPAPVPVLDPCDQTLEASPASPAAAHVPVHPDDRTAVDPRAKERNPRVRGGEPRNRSAATSALDQTGGTDKARAAAPPTQLPVGGWTAGDVHDATGLWDQDHETQRGDGDRRLPGGKTSNIAGYEILGELGRGAMGVVYKARQLRLNRIVALKMILAGGHASATELARFRIEAEAVAHLDHPNIVQVYEVGEHEGNPFFSLEFVEGDSLQKKVDGTPQPARQAADLTRTLAAAMYAAHQRGIIHRDLKPANVLLTRDSAPKITDFGLAKRIDDKESGNTRTGAILGTPSYMAPEQAQGRTKETGPEADIYSLGAILYDLLTGRPPFRGETVLDTLQQVQTAEAVPPSRLQPRVPRDLETICLKALAKDPHRRYASAGELAADLDRFLEGLPILARPTSWWERGLKWAHRHPAAACLAAVSVLALVSILTFGALWLDTRRRAAEESERQQAIQAVIERAHREEAEKLKKEAERARDDAITQGQRAESNFQHARDAVDQMLTSVGYEQLAYEPRMEQIRRDLLVKALKFYERFLKKKSSDPAIRLETGRAQLRVADIHEMLGQHEPAEKAFRTALPLLTELSAQFPDNVEYRRERATASNNLGNLLKETGRVGPAEQAYREALAARQQLAAAFPKMPDYRFELAGSYNNLGLALKALGRTRPAVRAFQESEKLLGALHQDYPARPAYAQELANSHNNHGTALAVFGKYAEAGTHIAEAQKLYAELADKFPTVPDYRQGRAVTHKHLGDLLRDTNPREAEAAYRLALKVRQALVADFPTVPAYRQEEAASHANLAVLLQATGRQREADKEYAEALAIRKQVAKDFPRMPDYRRKLATTYNNHGILLLTSSRLREAEEAYSLALEFFAKLAADYPDVPDYQQELAGTYLNLGSLFAAVGQPQKAEESYRHALTLQQALTDRFPRVPDHRRELSTTHLNLGILLQMNRNLQEAEKSYRQAVVGFGQLVQEFPGVPDYRHELAVSQNNLASLLRNTKRPQEAEDARRQGIEALAQLAAELPEVATYRQELARNQNELGILLASTGRSGDAAKLWEQVLEVQAKLVKDAPQQPDYRVDLAATYRNLGILRVQANKLEAAEKNYRLAIDVLEELEPNLPPTPAYYRDLVINHNNLATLLTALDRPEDAVKSRRRVVALEDKLVKAFPKVLDYRGDLARGLHDLAEQLFENEDEAEALRIAHDAVEVQQELVKLDPKDAAAQKTLLAYRLARLVMLVETGDHATAAAEAADSWSGPIPPERPKVGHEDHRVAALLARCVVLAQKDKRLSEASRKELAQVYGDQAMEFLQRARGAGFRDLSYLNNSKDFDPLRTREDFRQLLRDLATTAAAATKGQQP